MTWLTYWVRVLLLLTYKTTNSNAQITCSWIPMGLPQERHSTAFAILAMFHARTLSIDHLLLRCSLGTCPGTRWSSTSPSGSRATQRTGAKTSSFALQLRFLHLNPLHRTCQLWVLQCSRCFFFSCPSLYIKTSPQAKRHKISLLSLFLLLWLLSQDRWGGWGWWGRWGYLAEFRLNRYFSCVGLRSTFTFSSLALSQNFSDHVY